MKTHTFIFTICAVSALAFFGCSKKSVSQVRPTDSQNETVSAVQSETETEAAANAAVAQETQIAKEGFDAWSDEEKLTIKDLMNSPKGTDAGCTPGELDEAGLYMFTYIDRENDQRQTTLAPVIFSSNSAKPALEKYPSFKRTDYSDMRVVWYASSAASVMAFHEIDTPKNLVTILYSTDKWNTWSESHIETAPSFLDENKEPSCTLFCADSNTGYLLLGGTETIVVDGSHSGKAMPGARIFRTQDAGVSWEELCETKDGVSGYFFVDDGTVYLQARGGKLPRILKSDDYTNWKEINIPVNKEKYSSWATSEFRFGGKYGIAKMTMYWNEDGERKWENVTYATKDGGESWIVWDGK